MDNIKAVYKILSALEKAMDAPEFDLRQIGPEQLQVSEERWCRYIEMLLDAEYIKGVSVYRDITGDTRVDAHGPRITLQGLEYLQENAVMRRLYKAAKGISDLVP